MSYYIYLINSLYGNILINNNYYIFYSLNSIFINLNLNLYFKFKDITKLNKNKELIRFIF